MCFTSRPPHPHLLHPPPHQLDSLLYAILAGCGGLLLAVTLLLFYKIPSVAFLSEQRGWPALGGPLEFRPRSSQVWTTAQSWIDHHARALGLAAPRLDKLPKADLQYTGLTSETSMYTTEDYIVVQTASHPIFLPRLSRRISTSVLAKRDVTFVYLRIRDHSGPEFMAWFQVGTIVGIFGFALYSVPAGLVLGALHWWLSTRQDLHLGLRGGIVVSLRAPRSLDVKEFALDVIRKTLPPHMRHEVESNSEDCISVEGTLPLFGPAPQNASPVRRLVILLNRIIWFAAHLATLTSTMGLSFSVRVAWPHLRAAAMRLATRYCRRDGVVRSPGLPTEPPEPVAVGEGVERRSTTATSLAESAGSVKAMSKEVRLVPASGKENDLACVIKVFPLYVCTHSWDRLMVGGCEIRGSPRVEHIARNVLGTRTEMVFSPLHKLAATRLVVPGLRDSLNALMACLFLAVLLIISLPWSPINWYVGGGVTAAGLIYAVWLHFAKWCALFLADEERSAWFDLKSREAHMVIFKNRNIDPNEVAHKLALRQGTAARRVQEHEAAREAAHHGRELKRVLREIEIRGPARETLLARERRPNSGSSDRDRRRRRL